MNDPTSDAVSFTVGLAFLVSLVTLFRLFQRHIDGQPLLEYEPRRPVPWNSLAPLVMLGPLVLALWSALRAPSEMATDAEHLFVTSAASSAAIGAPPCIALASGAMAASMTDLEQDAEVSESLAIHLLLQSSVTIAMAIGCYTMLVVLFGARPSDLGLPKSWSEFARDVRLGGVAWAASVAPIYALLFALNLIVEPEAGHPLIEELVSDHSLGMMLAAGFAAVVAAPIYEETAFRLVLQGWLERRDMLARPAIAIDPPPPPLTENGAVDVELDPLAADGPAPAAAHVTYAYSPPGWTPVLISGTLFGLAHFGHGISPAPLILLGVIMGYLYQRTHRIAPSMVCHLLFNLFTFVLLALQFGDISR